MAGHLIHEDFLLSTPTARRLFHEHAAAMPIYDYHCHLPPEDLANNRRFETLADIWLEGDHYKWRAMRANGVPEEFITGSADPYDKFLAWARTVPFTLRNPLYHWTHLELKRYFDIDAPLNEDTAQEVWDEANRQLNSLTVSDILKRFKVALIATTDDPSDPLTCHQAINDQRLYPDTAVYPAFRPDKVYQTHDVEAWNQYIDRLAESAGTRCDTLDDLLATLDTRHQYFHSLRSRLSDHGLTHLPDCVCTEDQAGELFRRLRRGDHLSPEEGDQWTAYMMLYFGSLDARRGWVKQLHLGALRNTNPAAFDKLGPDSGFDSIGDWPQAPGLVRYLGSLAERNELPRTILYNLNPADNYVFATMIGNFQGSFGIPDGDEAPGRIQYGSGWWFLDQAQAMRWQMDALSNTGLLSRFIGMLTDSRSFMSYPRHEYFRRVLCDLIGRDVEAGKLPNDKNILGQMVENICFHNARRYFGMALRGLYSDGC